MSFNALLPLARGRGLPRGHGYARRVALLNVAYDPTQAFCQDFPNARLATIDERLDGWQKAQPTHFANHGTFDQIYSAGK